MDDYVSIVYLPSGFRRWMRIRAWQRRYARAAAKSAKSNLQMPLQNQEKGSRVVTWMARLPISVLRC
jgi:hypothetical protein